MPRATLSRAVSTRRAALRTPRRRSSSRPIPWLAIAARTSGASATRSTSFCASSLSRTLSQTRFVVWLSSKRSVARAAVSLSSARSTPRSTARSRPRRLATPRAPLKPARAADSSSEPTVPLDGGSTLGERSGRSSGVSDSDAGGRAAIPVNTPQSSVPLRGVEGEGSQRARDVSARALHRRAGTGPQAPRGPDGSGRREVSDRAGAVAGRRPRAEPRHLRDHLDGPGRHGADRSKPLPELHRPRRVPADRGDRAALHPHARRPLPRPR